jgi:hypothetical protein
MATKGCCASQKLFVRNFVLLLSVVRAPSLILPGECSLNVDADRRILSTQTMEIEGQTVAGESNSYPNLV